MHISRSPRWAFCEIALFLRLKKSHEGKTPQVNVFVLVFLSLCILEGSRISLTMLLSLIVSLWTLYNWYLHSSLEKNHLISSVVNWYMAMQCSNCTEKGLEGLNTSWRRSSIYIPGRFPELSYSSTDEMIAPWKAVNNIRPFFCMFHLECIHDI